MHALADKMLDGSIPDEISKPRMAAMKEKRDALIEQLEHAPEPPKVVTLFPTAVSRYTDAIRSLQTAVKAAALDPQGEDVRFMRELVSRVIVTRQETSDRVQIEVHGHLNVLLRQDDAQAAGHAGVGNGGCGGRI